VVEKMAKAKRPRSVISRVCKQVLLPAGFIRAKDLFVREHNGQVHGIDVQTSWGQLEYAINMTFHYAFLPGLFGMRHKPLEEYHVVDFVLRSRLGRFVAGHDQWWQCTPVDAEFETLLRERLKTAVRILDDCAVKWSDPNYFLDLVPPSVLAEEVPIEGVEPDEPAGTSVPKVWKLLPEWCPNIFDFAYVLCEIALREHRLTAAQGYADIALAQELGERYQWQKDLVRALRAKAVAAKARG
jgi:hypothetical protein